MFSASFLFFSLVSQHHPRPWRRDEARVVWFPPPLRSRVTRRPPKSDGDDAKITQDLPPRSTKLSSSPSCSRSLLSSSVSLLSLLLTISHQFSMCLPIYLPIYFIPLTLCLLVSKFLWKCLSSACLHLSACLPSLTPSFLPFSSLLFTSLPLSPCVPRVGASISITDMKTVINAIITRHSQAPRHPVFYDVDACRPEGGVYEAERR